MCTVFPKREAKLRRVGYFYNKSYSRERIKRLIKDFTSIQDLIDFSGLRLAKGIKRHYNNNLQGFTLRIEQTIWTITINTTYQVLVSK